MSDIDFFLQSILKNNRKHHVAAIWFLIRSYKTSIIDQLNHVYFIYVEHPTITYQLQELRQFVFYVKSWNNLPVSVRQSTTLYMFKARYRELLYK